MRLNPPKLTVIAVYTAAAQPYIPYYLIIFRNNSGNKILEDSDILH